MSRKARALIPILLVLILVVVWAVTRLGGSGEPEQVAITPIVILGIDALDWRYLGPMVGEGKLPNLAGLIEDGASGPLRSLEPRQESPVIWTTIATGKLPEKHGIMGYFTKDAAGVRGYSTTSNARKAKALWNIFSAAGQTVSVFSWLVTWPAEEVRGMLTTSNSLFLKDGLADSYWTGMVYPPELKASLENVMQQTEVTKEMLLRFINVTDESSLAKLPDHRISGLTSALRGDIVTSTLAKDLVPAYDPAVTLIYLRGLDETSHLVWHYSVADRLVLNLPQDHVDAFEDVIEKYYMFADEMCGELLALFPSDTRVVVCSDHGFAGYADEEKGIPGIGISQHGPYGVVILSGPGIRHTEIEGAGVEDIAPTVLYMAGYPVGADMDGRVLQEAFLEEYAQVHSIEQIDTYETGEATGIVEADLPSPIENELKEKLRTLGYIQ